MNKRDKLLLNAQKSKEFNPKDDLAWLIIHQYSSCSCKYDNTSVRTQTTF